MTRLVLHIGGHRTGSTSIQAALYASREKLLAQGILYPSTGLSDVAHHSLARGIRGSDSPRLFNSMLDELRREVAASKCSTVIISSEEMVHPYELSSERITTLFSVFESVRVVCFLRHQAPLLESGYKFEVLWDASAQTIDFADYIHQNTIGDHLAYSHIEPLYRAARPDIEIRFGSFAAAQRSGSLIREFQSIAGIPLCNIRELHTNESLGRSATLAVLMRNRGEIQDVGSRRNFVRFVKMAFPEQRQSLFNSDLLQSVEGRFSAGNAALARQIGFDLNDEGAAFRQRNVLLGTQLLPAERELFLSQLARRNRFPRLCLAAELLSRAQAAAGKRLGRLF